mmetsp:Transcript_21014/g.31699  ORF Transcript_21014/g.31699 Transcript_21014/m.31699 type:complete len:365 (-) Transcript_21014:31-1125(-)|eukprot:CAMPEP_0178907356 /NCGR_PEP_ID=MMETSP0786-20121207/7327_1 /TAXON_ID=186022 /ORGANISM="Thalassionema frauenfeldii, Strain CCMP 1798" /LENGTH=364 /DNA_ID=CAMNT_0020579149 /DNA_START=12 /DNA_END=1106 /DNA_ORIENTATION=+
MNALININNDILQRSIDKSFIHSNSSLISSLNDNQDSLIIFPLETGGKEVSLASSIANNSQEAHNLLKALAVRGSNQNLASLKLTGLMRPNQYNFGIPSSSQTMILAQKNRELALKTAAAEHAVHTLLLKNKSIIQNVGNLGPDLDVPVRTNALQMANTVSNRSVSSQHLGAVMKKDANDEALETLGSVCLERRKNKAPYFDASSLKDPDPITVATSKLRGGVGERFPEKLYRMLVEAQKDRNEDVISFFSHGRAFGIHKPKKFAKEIMPKYFRQSRVSSFQRQLNIYGFTRINTGPDAGGYYHELFLRGRPALSVHIRRVGVPQAIPRRRGVKAHDATQDPDFYSLPPITGDKNSEIIGGSQT